MRTTTRTTLNLLIGGLLLAGCGSTPKPPVLITADTNMKNAARVARAKEAAPEHFDRAVKHHKQAHVAFEDGEVKQAEHHATLANTSFETALIFADIADARTRTRDAEARVVDFERVVEEQNLLQARFEKRIARMEKILALQSDLESEKKRSKKEERALAKKLEEAKKDREKAEAEAKKAEEERLAKEAKEKAIAEVQGYLDTVAIQMQTADSLQGEKFDAEGLRGAKDLLDQAKRALTKGDLELAKKVGKNAEEVVTKVIEKARAEYAKQTAELNVLAERKALLEEAARVGASGAKQDERGVVITLQDMFASSSADLLPERKGVLDAIVALAKKYQDYPLIIEGYTDSRGRRADNLALSTSRAQSVSAFLVEGGLEISRIKSAGYGESNPVADNSAKEGRAKNRRVEVIFLFR